MAMPGFRLGNCRAGNRRVDGDEHKIHAWPAADVRSCLRSQTTGECGPSLLGTARSVRIAARYHWRDQDSCSSTAQSPIIAHSLQLNPLCHLASHRRPRRSLPLDRAAALPPPELRAFRARAPHDAHRPHYPLHCRPSLCSVQACHDDQERQEDLVDTCEGTRLRNDISFQAAAGPRIFCGIGLIALLDPSYVVCYSSRWKQRLLQRLVSQLSL